MAGVHSDQGSGVADRVCVSLQEPVVSSECEAPALARAGSGGVHCHSEHSDAAGLAVPSKAPRVLSLAGLFKAL